MNDGDSFAYKLVSSWETDDVIRWMNGIKPLVLRTPSLSLRLSLVMDAGTAPVKC